MWKFSRKAYSNAIFVTNEWKEAAQRFNRKIKGTFMEKWVIYWKQLARDYSDVAVNLKTEMQRKPLKSAVYITGLSTVCYCIGHNPDMRTFRAKYVECANELALVNRSLANSVAVDHLKYIEKCYNSNLIRYANLGILSIIWVDNYSEDCDTYECKCSYLQVPYRRFTERILDVGFLNTWWVISRKMLDYDINF
ncbi:unnamed protein product [Phyllotreta striolata]|uniref:Mitochondrial import inner membrane translocase subunit Tim29 n=1 Tax=Phyllotreta striolata TaxID=444603 RepID=A0A9N9XLU0_PHYSR|nr:unnamed protein product [Phyllotreta striolata]